MDYPKTQKEFEVFFKMKKNVFNIYLILSIIMVLFAKIVNLQIIGL